MKLSRAFVGITAVAGHLREAKLGRNIPMKRLPILIGLTATMVSACRSTEKPPEPQIAPAAIPEAPTAIDPPVLPESPKVPAAAVTAAPSAKPQTNSDPAMPALAQLGERCGGHSPNPKRCAAGLLCAVRKDGAVDGPSVCVAAKP